MSLPRKWPPELLSDSEHSPDKVVLCVPPTGPGCTNCGNRRFMYAYYLERGPFPSPPNTTREPIACFPERGGWYIAPLHAAPCPVCNGDQKTYWLRESCGLRGPDLEIRLENFKPLPGKEGARETAVELLAMNDRPHGFITFHGGYGVGKSTLLKALVNGFRLIGVLAIYTTMADLLSSVRQRYDDSQSAVEALLQEYRNVRVLAIDELDRINLTPWAKETAFRLLDARYNDHYRYLTVLATNTNPRDMDSAFAYLSSRMYIGRIVEIGGVDVRPAIGLQLQREDMSR